MDMISFAYFFKAQYYIGVDGFRIMFIPTRVTRDLFMLSLLDINDF